MDICEHQDDDKMEVTIRGQKYRFCTSCEKRMRGLTCNHQTRNQCSIAGQSYSCCKACQQYIRQLKGDKLPIAVQKKKELEDESLTARLAYKHMVKECLAKHGKGGIVEQLQSKCKKAGDLKEGYDKYLRHSEDIMQQSLTCLQHELDLTLCTECWKVIDSHCILGCQKHYEGQAFPEDRSFPDNPRQAFIIFAPTLSAERQFKLPIVEFVEIQGQEFMCLWHELLPEFITETADKIPYFSACARTSAEEYVLVGGLIMNPINQQMEIVPNCVNFEITRSQVFKGDFSKRYFFKIEKLLPLKVKRAGHALINSSRGLLAIGGHNVQDSYLSSVELYQEGQWISCPPMKCKRSRPTVFEINGQVVVSGGIGGKGDIQESIEILDLQLQQWKMVKSEGNLVGGIPLVSKEKALIFCGAYHKDFNQDILTYTLKDGFKSTGKSTPTSRTYGLAACMPEKNGGECFLVFGGCDSMAMECCFFKKGDLSYCSTQQSLAEQAGVLFMIGVEKESEALGWQKDYSFFLQNFKRDLKKCAIGAFH